MPTLIERLSQVAASIEHPAGHDAIDEAIEALEAAEKAFDEIDKHGVISPYVCNLMRIALEAIRK